MCAMVVVCGLWRLCVGRCGCVWVMAVVCGLWRLCVGRGGCVWVLVVVCRFGSCVRVVVVVCVGRGGCVWVMAVVCGLWRLWVGHGGCGCELREVSKDAIMCQSTNDFRHSRLTLVQSSYSIPY